MINAYTIRPASSPSLDINTMFTRDLEKLSQLISAPLASILFTLNQPQAWFLMAMFSKLTATPGWLNYQLKSPYDEFQSYSAQCSFQFEWAEFYPEEFSKDVLISYEQVNSPNCFLVRSVSHTHQVPQGLKSIMQGLYSQIHTAISIPQFLSQIQSAETFCSSEGIPAMAANYQKISRFLIELSSSIQAAISTALRASLITIETTQE